jgi:hypothetical protein
VYYDGVSTAKAEENLLLNSQDYSTVWIATNLTPITSKTAPDTTSTATEFTASAGNATLTQSVTAIAADYTFSVWLRRVTGTGDVDISAHSAGTWVTQSITSTWTRFSVTQTLTAGARTPGLRVVTSGDVIEVWGAQVEQRASVTAYTPTTTQPITNYVPVLQTAVNNQARFDHDPVTGESLGLLIEEQRTNLALRSEQFDDATWSKAGTIDTNVIVSPDGALTGDKLITTNTAIQHNILQFFSGGTLVNSTIYTYSCFAKAGEYSWIQLTTSDTNGLVYRSWFNLTTGTIGTVLAGHTASISHVGNDWYRCVVQFNSGTGASSTNVRLNVNSANDQITWTGDGLGGIYIWGAQLEAGAFPTSYIKTEASQVTRLADAASMTGTNFSSWYRQDEGTFCTESKWFTKRPAASISYTFLVNNLSGSSAITTGGIGLWNWSGSDNFNGYIFNNSGSNVWSPSISEAQANSTLISMTKQAFAYKLMDSAIAANGFVNTEAEPSSMPTALSVLNLAVGSARSQHIKRISYYPQRLTNTQLQALTNP